MQTQITLQALLQCGAIIMGIWGFYKVIMEIVKNITDRHDKEKKWDQYEKNLQEERDKIYEKYDNSLEVLQKRIDENHADTEAKIQELKAEMLIQLECIQAILQGMEQLKCNGPVTEAKENLDKHLREKAYE